MDLIFTISFKILFMRLVEETYIWILFAAFVDDEHRCTHTTHIYI